MKLGDRLHQLQVICLVVLIPVSLEKELGLPRLITRWELEFTSLHFRQSLSKFPCSADGAFSVPLPVSVVVRYVLPNGHTGMVSLSMERPEVSCSDGSVKFGTSGSSNRMTISVVNDKACLEGAGLQLYINIHTQDASTPAAYFYKVVYSAQNGPVGGSSLLRDRKKQSLLRLNWRAACGKFQGRSGITEDTLRLKRQAPDEGPSENALGGLKNDTTNSSLPIFKDETIPAETSNAPLSNFTSRSEIVGVTEEPGELFSSGEPPDSFVTGIGEIFGLTKKPVSPIGSKTTHPATNTQQFSSMLQTLFGPTADVSTLLSRSSSIPIDLSSWSNTYTPSMSSPVVSSRLAHPDRPSVRNEPSISAPAAERAASQNPDLQDPNMDSGPNNTAVPVSEAGFSQDTTTPSVGQTGTKDKISSTTIEITSENTEDGHMTKYPTLPTGLENRRTGSEATTTSVPTTASPGLSDHITTKYNVEFNKTSLKDTKTSTTTPKSTTIKTTTLSTKTTKLSTTPSTTTKTKPTSRARSSTRKDVIFTKAKTKPTPPYPETSNEAYMGKTGDGSSAGRVEDKPGSNKDADDGNEATLWPIVMGLVIGVPTIIVLSIAITVVQKKHIGVPHRHLSSPGYFERRPPPVPFVSQKPVPQTCQLQRPPTDIEV